MSNTNGGSETKLSGTAPAHDVVGDWINPGGPNELFLIPASTGVTRKGKENTFYLMTHSTHFIYSYMASDIR